MKGVEKIMASADRFGRLAEEFKRESDRGCAVLVLCVLEDALREVIKAFVVDPNKSIDRLAPKGGLNVAIDSTVLLGLLTERQGRAFKQLVAVRNRFAHGVFEGLTFDTPDIAKMVREAETVIPLADGLKLDDELNDKSVRTRFLQHSPASCGCCL